MCVLTAESRVKLMIGAYVLQIATLESQTEAQAEQIAALTKAAQGPAPPTDPPKEGTDG